MRNCTLATVLFATCLLVSSCGNRKSNSSVHVEHSPSWGIVSETKEASPQPEEPHVEPIKLDYKPKASFTSIAYMESLFPSDEEEYMSRIHYEGLEAQKLSHEAFVTKLKSINMEELDENQSEYLNSLIQFLLSWLSNHILKMDKLIPNK